jgi:Protein of unknown function (DUF3822)
MQLVQYEITPLLEVKDPIFSPDNCAEYELLIELSSERFRFIVLGTTQKRVLCLEDYQIDNRFDQDEWADKINGLIHQHEFLGFQSWKNITISFNSPVFTLIPDTYFRKEYVGSYIKLINGEAVKEHEQVLHHAVRYLEAKNVFTANKTVWESLLNIYTLESPTIVHQTGALIEGALIQSLQYKTQVLANLYFEEGFVTVTVAQNGKLLLCNKFHYKAAIDMGYFVLFVLDSIGLKAEDVTFSLYGEITPYSEDYQLLKKFIPQLLFGKNPTNLTFGEVFDDLPDHRYFSLYSALIP